MTQPPAPDVSGLGTYHVVRRIAVGGMAEVLLARQIVRPGIERMVVIKSILPGLSEHADLVTMFLSEARIAAQLQHPNVVHIHDVTRIGTRPCIVMEQLTGLDVRNLGLRLRERREALPLGLVAAIGEGAALGLGYAHRAKGVDGQALSVVHRDVSPHNVFVTVDGSVKILDFGIAKSSAQLQATRDGTLKGKVAYMSPEQLRGVPLDGRSDLFALGSVLWELVTGHALFARPTEVESFAAVLEHVVPPPSTFRPGVPAALEQAIMKMLSRDVEQRYATGEELARALHPVAEAECDGPPAMALARLVRSIVEEPERPMPAVSPAVPTLAGLVAPAEEGEATDPAVAEVDATSADTPAALQAVAPAPPAPSFAAGELTLEGIDAPGREEELPTAPRASRPEPKAPTPPPASRASQYPERASSIPPHVRDRFDPDGEDLGAGERSSPRLELAVDVALDRRERGQPIPDADRRAAAVADFGKPPFFLFAPFYTLRVILRRAALAARVRELTSEIPILEAEVRAAQAAIGKVVHDASRDHRLSGEKAAVDRAADRAASAAEAAPKGKRDEKRIAKARLEAEVGLEEKLADLGKAAVSRVAAASETAPLEAAARAAIRKLDEARTERELCERGRETYDPAAFRNGWMLVFLAAATAATYTLVAYMQP